MSTLRRHPQAEQDLIDIYLRISLDNPDAAERMVRAINEKCAMLARHPLFGRPRPDLRADLRSFPHRSYLILYRLIEGGVEIVRVVHGARNLEDLI